VSFGARARRLALRDYRSYPSADVVFDGRPAAFHGPNGAGKTNVLEALSLFAPGRGLRRAAVAEAARSDGPGGWALSLAIGDEADVERLGVAAEPSAPGRKVCRIDGETVAPGAFADRLGFLWLTPAQDRLFAEGASERRRFLDRMTLAHAPAHARAASDYERAMRERQRLLDEGVRDPAWLAGLEARMAEAGAVIALRRREMVARLAGHWTAADAFPRALIAIEGGLEADLAPLAGAEAAEFLAARLAGARRRDEAAGRALEGPHRADLAVVHAEKNQPAKLCSTGEQKALLIGLVLANAASLTASAVAHSARPAPLFLLLDEVAAHLDERRRSALFSAIDSLGVQAFATGTDRALFDAWGDRCQRFRVDAGAVVPDGG